MARLVSNMCRESPRFQTMAINQAHVEDILVGLSKNEKAYLAVYDTEKGIEGIMVGAHAPYLFNNDFYAVDLIVYVIPEARGSRAAVSLVQAFERWAKATGANEVVLGVSTGIDTDKTACFYERLGYNSVSKGFAKGLR